MKTVYSIEGNIGVGKSTLVEFIKNNFENVIIVPEPVDIWNTVVDRNGTNIIENYYYDPPKYAYCFQMMCYITRLTLLKKCYQEAPDGAIIITERCLHTDRNIFAQMLYDTEILNDIEYTVYTKWFDTFINEVPIHGIIYMDLTPEIAFERIMLRDRKGESEITMEYLYNLRKYHLKWIETTSIPSITIDATNLQDKQTMTNSFNRLDLIIRGN